MQLRSISRISGLDGLRGIAVLAVVAFHIDPVLLPGGFLGVDVFFVISGFLITRLLLVEFTDTGTIRLGRFYRRRVRRLFPASCVLIAAVCLSALVWRDTLATLQASVVASLGYATNWWLIFDQQSYFVASGRPPMLQHLWSLAIEEQYYLLWPVLIVFLIRRRQGNEVGKAAGDNRAQWCLVAQVLWVALILALASTLAMTITAVTTCVPYSSDSSRVYFGTDTHSMGLFLGSAAGAWSVLRRKSSRCTQALRQWLTDGVGLLSLGLLFWQLGHLDEFVPGLYRGGFLAIDGLVVVVLLVATQPASQLGRWLDARALRWIGRRSYSIYLWHWPVVVVTRPGIDLQGSPVMINIIRVCLIVALAQLSYRYVEVPLRARHRAVRLPGQPTLRRLFVTALPVVLVMTCVALLLSSGVPGSSRPATATEPVRPSPPVTPLFARPAPSLIAPTAGPALPSVPTPRATPTPTPTPTPALSPALSAFGDSVLLGAREALRAHSPQTVVDAVVGRQAQELLNDVVAAHRSGQLRKVVVIGTGNNGIIDPAQLDRTLALLRDRSKVVLINSRVPRAWQQRNNQTLADASRRGANVVLLDWHQLSAGHPDWLAADGLHLTAKGVTAYVALVLAAAT